MDSVQLMAPDRGARRLHSHAPGVGRTTQGHIHKGNSIAAPSSTIPTRYQTIVIDNSERRGFGAQTRRFQYESMENCLPGPGTYQKNVNTNSSVNSETPSWSKRGVGGLAGREKRRQIGSLSSVAPSPASYDTSKSMINRQDHCVAPTSSAFAAPLAVQREIPLSQRLPGPGAYDAARAPPSQRTNNVAAIAAFKSNSRRELIDLREAARKPGPAHYSVEQSDSQQSSAVHVPYSSFKSTSQRQIMKSPDSIPGPGAYDHLPNDLADVKRQTLPRKHYLCLSAPALALPSMPPSPGPGHYELVNAPLPKHYMSSSVFLSNTSRWTGANASQKRGLPGPAHYQPTLPAHQSFLYNAAGKWVA